MNERNEHTLLEQRLRSERPRFKPRVGFTERVMDSLPARVDRPQADTRIPWPRFVLALAATGCIALALSQLLPRDVHLPQTPTVVESQQEASPTDVTLPKVSMTQVQDLVARLDEPLETELKNLISDSRQAIQFVASNFLPEN